MGAGVPAPMFLLRRGSFGSPGLYCEDYPVFMMKTVSRILVLCLLASWPALSRAAAAKPYDSGKVLTIEQKARTRVLYYLVNTPVTQDDPYYEVTVQVKNMVYVGEYTPRHSSDTLPDDWKADTLVPVRLEKRHLYLKRPSGDELDLVITKKRAADAEVEKPQK